jgi:outer membrane biosynthesis protein TonB
MRRRTFGLACVLTYLLTIGSYAQSGSVQSGSAEPAQTSRLARISGGVMAGNILTRVQPVFPKEARDQHVNGSVVMRVIIGTDGLVKSVEPVSGPELLRQPYADAVKQWTYKPYLLNGRPVEVETIVTININASGDAPTPLQN